MFRGSHTAPRANVYVFMRGQATVPCFPLWGRCSETLNYPLVLLCTERRGGRRGALKTTIHKLQRVWEAKHFPLVFRLPLVSEPFLIYSREGRNMQEWACDQFSR